MGSAYPTIAADAFARYQRLQGKAVHFLTGTDEHGEKIALAAEKRGMTPQQHCDDVVSEYKALWQQLDIKFDHFIRTTDAKHETVVREVLQRVWDKGDIYKADYEGWYCVDCEEFKDEKEMDEQHNCPTHRKPCQHRKEGNYFFRLSKYQKEIEELLAEGSEFVQPAARRNELTAWVKEGVKDFSISRAAVAWGIPIPQDPQQTVYVWFDALNGYISGLLPEGAAATAESAAAHGWPASVHIIGKDILRFHAVYWPGMLISAGLPLPKKVFGHGFLTKDGLKMGKSLGNVLDPKALVGAYGADAVRFYFMKEIVFGQDGDFSEQRFRDTVNAALANNIGNMLNRTLNLLHKNCDGQVVLDLDTGLPQDLPLRSFAQEKVAEAKAAYDNMNLGAAIDAIVALCARGNQFMDEKQPWTALKKGSDEEKADAAVALCVVLEVLRIAAVALSPVTPALSARIYKQLGFSEQQLEVLTWADTQWGTLKKGHLTAQPQPVFARLEGDLVTEPAPPAAPAVSGGTGKQKQKQGKGPGKKGGNGEGQQQKQQAAAASVAT